MAKSVVGKTPENGSPGEHRKFAASTKSELSMGWVDPWVGLGWVGLGQDFSVFGGLGWVHYSKSTNKY